MTATLDEIHRDPAILDRAIHSGERLEITAMGKITATLTPSLELSQNEARETMKARFAAADWSFTVGTPMTREERNARS